MMDIINLSRNIVKEIRTLFDGLVTGVKSLSSSACGEGAVFIEQLV